MGSQALRDRLFLAFEQEAAVLAPVIAEQAGEPGKDPASVADALRREARRAYDPLEGGIAAYGAT